jgi:hypothetical protein
MANYIDQYKKIFQGGKFLRNGKEITLTQYQAFDGGGARCLYDKLLEELKNKTSVTVLDFGSGNGLQWHKQTLSNGSKSLPNLIGEKLQGFYRYDPAFEIYSKKPSGVFDFIICADVLEHIPDNEFEEFFTEINSYTHSGSVIFYSISTKLSNNYFLDGQNMHVNIKNYDDWANVLKKYSKTKICVVFNGVPKY